MKLILFSKQKDPKENYFDLTIELNCPLQISNHVIALAELTGRVQAKDDKKKTPLYLCCDLCEDSNVFNIKMPVIRQILRSQGGNISNTLNNMVWVKVNRENIKRIRLYIADINGELQTLTNCLLNGTLVLKHEDASC